ncbi:HAMP domain-containing histidine kinase [Hymenobacter sp. RP-2-7]|uniref:HAMP domain-containing histidine kinase n=1 Tax=Hymenobacter polaris TaxID=2682546 RepID=A0A7Y0AEX9_9BACT|nr:HAMP domain-containing histidine kinase [Hymenobacter polaris]NML66098.1 HAMP domain-containing histidine kinase [Hymenobacter polaris]
MSHYLQFVNERGEVRYNTVPLSCASCVQNCSGKSSIVKCEADGTSRRQGKIVIDGVGFAYMCTDDIDMLKSANVFKVRLKLYGELLLEMRQMRIAIRTEAARELKRLIHNITSNNAHSIQELYSLVPQEAVTKNIRKQISTVSSYIRDNESEVALTLLKLAKHNAALKTEIIVFNKIYEESPSLSFKRHRIHKVVMNVMHLFGQELLAANVDVQVQPSTEQIEVDYDSLHVALYHFFDNTTKYILPDSTLYISFKRLGDLFILSFKMMSTRIGLEEKGKIFEEGYSGTNAKKAGKSGDGIGMYQIQRLLKINNAYVYWSEPMNYENSQEIEGVLYDENTFDFIFDTNALRGID